MDLCPVYGGSISVDGLLSLYLTPPPFPLFYIGIACHWHTSPNSHCRSRFVEVLEFQWMESQDTVIRSHPVWLRGIMAARLQVL